MPHLAMFCYNCLKSTKHYALLLQHSCFLLPTIDEEASMQIRRARVLRIILTLFLTLLLLILAQTMQAAEQPSPKVVGIVQQLTDSLSGGISTP